jgi:hypothetical protein
MDDLAGNIEAFAKAAREAATIPGKLKLAVRVFTSGTPASWFAWIGLVLFLAALAAVPFVDTTVLAVSIERFQKWSFLTTAAALLAAIWKGYRLVKPILDGAASFSKNVTDDKKRLNAVLVAREAEIAALKRRRDAAREGVVTALDNLERYGGSGNVRAPEAALRYLLHDAAESASFEQGLGIVSRARRSFEKLDEIIRRVRNEPKDQNLRGSEDSLQSAFSVVAVPDRIILYIDDLDRCTHKQVYEVLQAVHLLLALESFVVIVGVDIRWIDGAIANHFEADLSADPPDKYPDEKEVQDRRANDSNAMRRSRSLEYLEKIFQIPFWLRTINSAQDGTYSKLMRQLLADNRPLTTPSPPVVTSGVEKSTDQNKMQEEAGRQTTEEVGAFNVLRETLVGVTLTQQEYDFLQSSEIGSLVGKSPRAVKRFVNIYRILRARRRSVELARFLGASGRPPLFPTVMLLLAIDVGQTPESARSFRKFVSAGKTQTFDEAVGVTLTMSDDSEHWFAEQTGIDKLDGAIKLIRSLNAGQLSMAEWTELADEVRRYSFNDPRA